MVKLERGISMNRFFATVFALVAAVACSTLATSVADACTRCVYLGPDGMIVVARSMDWAEDPGTNLYCFPRGMKRDGAAGPRSINWTSKYGSVGCAFYEAGTVDGMNERGLVANVLYLVESDYGKPDGRKPTLSITAWGQYVWTTSPPSPRRSNRSARSPLSSLPRSCPTAPLPRVIFRCRIRRATRPSSSISAADFTSTMDASIR